MIRSFFFLIFVIGSLALPLCPKPKQDLCVVDDTCVSNSIPQSQPDAPSSTSSGKFIALTERHEFEKPTQVVRSISPTLDIGNIFGFVGPTPGRSENNGRVGQVATVSKRQDQDNDADDKPNKIVSPVNPVMPFKPAKSVPPGNIVTVSKRHIHDHDNDDDHKLTRTSLFPQSTSYWGIGPAEPPVPLIQRNAPLDDSYGPPHNDERGILSKDEPILFDGTELLPRRRESIDSNTGQERGGEHHSEPNALGKDGPILIQRRDWSLADMESAGNSHAPWLPSVPFHKRQPDNGGWTMADMFSSGDDNKPELPTVPYRRDISTKEIGAENGLYVERRDQHPRRVPPSLPAGIIPPSIGRRRVKHERDCCHHSSHCTKEEIKKAKCHHKATQTTKTGYITASLSRLNNPIFTPVILPLKSGLRDPNNVYPASKRDQVPSTPVPKNGQQKSGPVPTQHVD